jgi:signal transduction histidine kinase
LVLESGYSVTDRLELYELEGNTVLRHAAVGDHVPTEQWDIVTRLPAFRLAPRARHQLLLRLTGGASHQLPLTLYAPEHYEAHRRSDLALQCLYFGALGVMVAYNLLIGLVTRSRAYWAYTVFLAFFGAFQAAHAGFGPVLLGTRFPVLLDFSVPLFMSGLGVSGVSFVGELLELRRHRPKLFKAMRLYQALVLVTFPVACVLGYPVAIRAVLFLVLAWVPLLVTAGLLEAREGKRVAKIYLATWWLFLLGIFVGGLRALGIVATNVWTTNLLQVGSVLAFLLLSFALADRINTLQAEARHHAELAREASVRALTEQERVNVELKRLDKMKDEFLANTSHELRTPLHGILGLTEGVLGAEEGLDERSRSRLRLVLVSGRRLVTLVNDLLDFSKLRNGELVLRETVLELAPWVDLAFAVVQPLAEAKGLRKTRIQGEDLDARTPRPRCSHAATSRLGHLDVQHRPLDVDYGHVAHVNVEVDVGNAPTCRPRTSPAGTTSIVQMDLNWLPVAT